MWKVSKLDGCDGSPNQSLDDGSPGQDEWSFASNLRDSWRRRRGFRQTVQIVSVVLEGAVRVAGGHANGVHSQPEFRVAVGNDVRWPLVLQGASRSVLIALRAQLLQGSAVPQPHAG